jgi:hypothetical protein
LFIGVDFVINFVKQKRVCNENFHFQTVVAHNCFGYEQW